MGVAWPLWLCNKLGQLPRAPVYHYRKRFAMVFAGEPNQPRRKQALGAPGIFLILGACSIFRTELHSREQCVGLESPGSRVKSLSFKPQLHHLRLSESSGYRPPFKSFCKLERTSMKGNSPAHGSQYNFVVCQLLLLFRGKVPPNKMQMPREAYLVTS